MCEVVFTIIKILKDPILIPLNDKYGGFFPPFFLLLAENCAPFIVRTWLNSCVKLKARYWRTDVNEQFSTDNRFIKTAMVFKDVIAGRISLRPLLQREPVARRCKYHLAKF